MPSQLIKYLSPLIVDKGQSLSWIIDRPIAHRGTHSQTVPENSLGAFKASIDLGLPIELDVHLLKDNKVVVFHDDELKRMTGVRGKIAHCDSQMIEDFRLLDSDEKIPLLRDVFDLVADRVPIILEIKNTNYDGRLEDAVCDLLEDYKGRVALQSFNPFSLIHCRKRCPDRPRGILTASEYEDLAPYKKWLLNSYIFLPRIRPTYIAHEFNTLTYSSLHFFRKFEILPVLAWTIRSVEDRKKILNLCDNIIFENIPYPFT